MDKPQRKSKIELTCRKSLEKHNKENIYSTHKNISQTKSLYKDQQNCNQSRRPKKNFNHLKIDVDCIQDQYQREPQKKKINSTPLFAQKRQLQNTSPNLYNNLIESIRLEDHRKNRQSLKERCQINKSNRTHIIKDKVSQIKSQLLKLKQMMPINSKLCQMHLLIEQFQKEISAKNTESNEIQNSLMDKYSTISKPIKTEEKYNTNHQGINSKSPFKEILRYVNRNHRIV